VGGRQGGTKYSTVIHLLVALPLLY